jgi:ParB family transcriptional regulator, chromosome partitioning protein
MAWGDSQHRGWINSAGLGLEPLLASWFTPTADNFFGRVSEDQIADVLTEAGRPLGLQELKTKKGELASIAAKEIKGTGWLRKPLRVKSPEVATEAKA